MTPRMCGQVDDPFAALGASVGPNTRSDFVQKTVEKREAKKGKAKAKKSVSAAPADETAPAPANKVIYLRPSNTSKSARNLCLTDYNRTIGKVTKADFDAHYRGLPAETLKMWQQRSAAASASSASVVS
ncbi:hypothetical protein C8R47DRAFT_1218857 [Mycena vitilis]|nr:hypothetical protein C8R47DRAFT_1218857 [Mycena vitilis]